LGRRLRSLRESAGERLIDVSNRSGVSISHLSDIEHDRRLPSLDALLHLARAFDLTIPELLIEVEPYGG
jgi:transcriptional regulator with XRE-family HTH domain